MRILRGIRGATTVERDEREEVRNASFELFTRMLSENDLSPDDIAGVLITATPDIRSTFPAEVIREREDFRYIPILCAQEMEVEGAPARCIRMLILAYTMQRPKEIHHVYLRGAQSLRRDLMGGEEG